MDTHLNIGKSNLHDFFDFYRKQGLDDVEYIPIVKIIINGASKPIPFSDLSDADIQHIKDTLKEINRDLYVGIWLKHAKEDEGNINVEEETESARYYFDYIYEHGKHPR